MVTVLPKLRLRKDKETPICLGALLTTAEKKVSISIFIALVS